MAKKGPVIHNHVDSINLEIDYDKLAKAIVQANKATGRPKRRHMKFRAFLMGMCNGIVYLGLASVLIYRIVQMWFDHAQQQTPDLFLCIIITILGGALTVLLFISQQETCNDSDDEVLTHFNSSVSFVALIVALVALLKG